MSPQRYEKTKNDLAHVDGECFSERQDLPRPATR